MGVTKANARGLDYGSNQILASRNFSQGDEELRAYATLLSAQIQLETCPFFDGFQV